MSHELRTPLNAILGFGQLLEMDPLEAHQEQGVEHILKAGRHLLALIDEVLNIARIEAGHLNLVQEPGAIHALLNELVTLLGPLANRRQIRLDYASIGEMTTRHVLADEKGLRQVLLNLLSNASNIIANWPGADLVRGDACKRPSAAHRGQRHRSRPLFREAGPALFAVRPAGCRANRD